MAWREDIGRGIYHWSCANCGGPNTEFRLLEMLPCDQCLPPGLLDEVRASGNLYDVLRSLGTLKSLGEIHALEKEVSDVSSFFEACVGSPPWGAQKTWIKRFVRGDSFSIVAPTGMGKTTLGLVLALYLACKKGMKTYIIAPTVTLVAQIAEKLEAMSRAVECSDRARIVHIHAKMKQSAKREASRRVEEGDFDILVTTIAYARKNLDVLRRSKFRLIFVDDVDAVLKSGRSIETVLKIAGFSDEDLEAARRLLQIEREIARLVEGLEDKPKERRKEVLSKVQELQVEREKLRNSIVERRSGSASLIVSSATGRPGGAKARIFRALLGFEVGGRSDIGLRNIVDVYLIPEKDLLAEAVDIIKKLGKGTLVYVPNDWGIEGAERVASLLREAGVNAHAYHSKTPFEVFGRFQQGEVEVLVGVANYYGPLVRGIDLPEIVRHAVFVGVPRHKFPLSAEEIDPHPSNLSRLVGLIAELEVGGVSDEARRLLGELRRMLRRYTQAYLSYIVDKIKAGAIGEGDRVAETILRAVEFARRALRDPQVVSKISEKTDIGVVEENGRTYILIADVPTYLQASGRTSRLYAGGITKGLSIVVADNVSVLRRLMSRSRYIADIEWVDFRSPEFKLEKVLEEIEEDRRRVSEILRKPSRGVERKELVKTALLVVESPNKARTIASFFGRPSVRVLPGGLRAYEVPLQNYVLVVAASGGHVYDLVPSVDDRDLDIAKRFTEKPLDLFGVIVGEAGGRRAYVPVYSSIKRCLLCNEQFTEDVDYCPRCGSRFIRDSRRVIDDLRRLAWESDIVFIGTDPDTEGEKIGWDLAVLIKPFNKNIRRLEFHEVTRQAILKALENPREFNEKLVEAQIVRRVEDRWIGFTLSPLLWCDFWPNYYCQEVEASVRQPQRELEACRSNRYNYNLSAGRVQTPALGWVVRRMSEIRKIDLYTLIRHDTGEAFLTIREDETALSRADLRPYTREDKSYILEVRVRIGSSEWITVQPPPPFTTDSLILEANRRLGLSAPEVMRLAQDLFEWGLITYHRTDSTRVSERGMEVAREWLKQAFGDIADQLFRPRRWSEGGAHEAIRPVKPIDATMLQLLIEDGSIELPGSPTQRHMRLYDLIFRRFLASQMREAEIQRTTYLMDILGHTITHTRVTGVPEDKVKLGFLNVLPEAIAVQRPLLLDSEEEDLRLGRRDYVDVRCIVRRKSVSSAMPYTQGELVEEMKRRGIGRPSTYAKIVETLLKRGYIATLKKPRGGYIVATKRGKLVYEYLTKWVVDKYGSLIEYLSVVPRLVSEERTRQLEESMDEIERGDKSWVQVLDDVYREVEGLAHAIRFASIAQRGEGGFWRELAECIAGRSEVIKRGREREG